MHVHIDSATTGGLRLLPDLALHRLGRLEGYNGIGKSAAIRLLQVCTGDQPYPEDQVLWSSFRASVGSTVVTMTGLSGAERVEWHLDPDVWPPTNDVPLESVGRILIDGAEREFDAVRAMLRVHRVVGSEGLEPTLARELAPFRRTVTEALGPRGRIVPRLDELDALFHSIQDVASVASLPLGQAIEDEERSAEAEQAAQTDRDAVANTADSIAAAQTVAGQLEDVLGKSGDLDLQTAELDIKIAASELTLADLDARITEATQRAGAQTQVSRELTNSQRHAARMARRVQDATVAVLAEDSRLGLGTRDPLNLDLDDVIASSNEELERLQRELSSLNLAPRLVALAEQVIDQLRSAESQGLAAEKLLDLADSPPCTVAELRAGLEARAAVLREMPKPERAEQIEQQLALQRERSIAFDNLRRKQAAMVAALEAEAKADARVRAAVAALGKTRGDTLDKLTEQRRECIHEIQQLAIAKAEVVRAREGLGGGFTEQDLEHRLNDLLNQLALAASQLPSAARQTEQALERAQQSHAAAMAARRQAAARLESIENQITTASRVVGDDPALAWLRRAVGDDLPSRSADRQVWLTFLGNVTAMLEKLRSRLDTARARAREIGGAFESVEKELLNGPVERSEWTSRVRDWFSGHVSTWFQQPQLLDTLFPGGTDVRVDLADKSVRWRLDDDVLTRPLNAFSSGERAFAYTRARLALIESNRTVPNQLIALDEFGAFMAREWLHRLEDYLRQHVADHDTDRVLLILPLTVTEADLARQGIAGADQLAQLRKREYSIQNPDSA